MNGQAGSAVEERLGLLAASGWIAVPTGLMRARKQLGLNVTDVFVVIGVLGYYRTADVWSSTSQGVLADDTGLTRAAVNKSLARLRRAGLVATKPNPALPTRGSATYLYSLTPLFVATLFALSRAKRQYQFSTQASRWLAQFVELVRTEGWTWSLGELSSSKDPVDVLNTEFARRYAAR